MMHDELRERIAGDIALSDDPGRTIRKWREEFSLSQQQLASAMGVSNSVISDYESGRRRTPGVGVIKKMVDSLIAIDVASGSRFISKYSPSPKDDCVIAMEEFPYGIDSGKFIEAISGKDLNPNRPVKRIYGYTVVDSLKAIMNLKSSDYLKIYGWSTERALIFTNVRFGRSPMVAVRAHPLTPAMVVYVKPDKIDTLAVKLAELEGVPLVVTDTGTERIILDLKKIKEGI